MLPFNIIVAMDEHNGIGKNGRLPWHLPADLKHFKEITCQTTLPSKKNVVIMGRRTWESLPKKFQPLPGRINLVLTRNKNFSPPSGVLTAKTFEEAFKVLSEKQLRESIEQIFVIGGGEVFKEALQSADCRRIYATHIRETFDCDVFFPPFENRFKKKSGSAVLEDNSLRFFFTEYVL